MLAKEDSSSTSPFQAAIISFIEVALYPTIGARNAIVPFG
jgi:hypothetical protein